MPSDMFTFLAARKAKIAELRKFNLDCTANNLLSDTINELENWLDPTIAQIRADQLAADREATRAAIERCHLISQDIDPTIGF